MLKDSFIEQRFGSKAFTVVLTTAEELLKQETLPYI